MNLKEAFRHQNFLDRMLDLTTAYLGNQSNITKITQEHMRIKANPEAQDEKIDTTKDRKLLYSNDTLVDFAVHILEHKESLSQAINLAKTGCGIDIDSAVAINKRKQEFVRCLSMMVAIQSSETIKTGKGYKFNAEGNQTPYTYDVKEVSVIDFDRKKVKAIAKKLITEADAVSAKLDQIMVETPILFTTLYDVNDSFEDTLEIFCPLPPK